MRKILAIVAVCLFATASLVKAENKQQLTINGQAVESVVSRITFDGDNVVLHFVGGDSQTVEMDAVVLGFEYSTVVSINALRGTVDNFLNLQGIDEGTVVSVYDAQGKLVATTTAHEAKAVLSVSTPKSGVYMLKAGRQAVKFIKK
ncbi:MAG: T9SS type A sorting domain-containing protein [Prevotella sp.]|nr:T9SS type A sorting domain-containing protein [Prevotella sp.]